MFKLKVSKLSLLLIVISIELFASLLLPQSIVSVVEAVQHTSTAVNETAYGLPQSSIPQRSSFRSEQARKSVFNTSSSNIDSSNISQTYTFNTSQGVQRKKEKLLFRIGLIVPKTSFSSQYKTYTQRIKDHLLQLSRQQTQYDGAKPTDSSISGSESTSNTNIRSILSVSQQTIDNSNIAVAPCNKKASSLAHFRLTKQKLAFNQHFDIRVVDLVNFAPRSSAYTIIESMCQKLIEQNVSVIVYLDNNQDEAVIGSSSLDNQPFVHQTKAKSQQLQKNPMSSNQAFRENGGKIGASSNVLIQQQATRSDHSSTQSFNGPSKTSSQAHFIMHLAHSAGIPMIAWSVMAAQAPQMPKRQKTLHLAPTVAHEAEAMLAIMKRYSWYSFSVVSSTLAGHEDFILALRHFMAATNGGSSSASMNKANSFGHKTTGPPYKLQSDSSTKSSQIGNISIRYDNYSSENSGLDSQVLAQPSKTFKLLDVITIRQRTLAHIEEEILKLTVSESRVILLYSTRGEAIDILKVANRLKLTKRSYAWLVARSVIGPNENEIAPLEFHPGLLGVYFRSDHDRLLDELSRAITIIIHGLENFIRDEESINNRHPASVTRNKSTIQQTGINCEKLHEGGSNNTEINTTCDSIQKDLLHSQPTIESSSKQPQKKDLSETETKFISDQHYKVLTAHSKCHGKPDEFSEYRRDLLYEKSSLWNEFDADGLLKNVELDVINLNTERQWRRIGCFSDATLTIDDITWPEQAERPPSGTMEKFHLKAVFLEEPAFLNLADLDSETGTCKTNRAVRCRYKVARRTSNASVSSHGDEMQSTSSSLSNSSHEQNQRAKHSGKDFLNDGYEYKCCSGYCIDLIEKLAADLKFTYELHRVPDGLWGILENNTWNGLIGEIVSGKADIIVSSVKINSDRQEAVDFTEPYLDTGISILVGKQTGVISKLAFLEPFDALAWIMFIFVGIPLATASIFLFELLSPSGFYSQANASQDETNENDRITVHHKFSFCRTLWLVITILFGSAAHIDSPKGYTARFMSNVWATFSVVFLAVYTANLAAFMITREEYLELSGINDSRLAYPYHKHPPLKFATILGGNTHAVLSSNRPKLYDYMRAYNQPTVEDGIEAVKKGQLDAFIYDSLVLDYLASQDQECKLVNVGSWYSMTGYAFAFPRNSRYYDKFNMKMLEYRKNGELDRLRRFWMQGLCKPGQNRHSKSKPLDINQFMSAFLLLGAGMIFSVIVFIFEHLYILYLRNRLIKCRRRKQLLKYLYPFSLSLTESLRLPIDPEEESDESERVRNSRFSARQEVDSSRPKL